MQRQNNFKNKVVSVVKKIPKGKVMTYQEVATRAGSAQAYRAVANIMSRNFDTTVPCHRVIRKDGALGGYNRGGVSAKYALLKAEGVKRGHLKTA